ncbi:MAG: tetratricopeptide repeat protein, partial [Myxococcales bacterium]|nr:tetratricopeptide repeat protein [Myxococcales bacterium]
MPEDLLGALFHISQVQELEQFVLEVSDDKPTAGDLSWLAKSWFDSGPDGRSRAIELQRLAIEQASEDDLQFRVVLLTNLGMFAMAGNEYQAAVDAFDQAIELDPNYPTTRNWYSVFLAHTGRAEESLSELELALRLDPVNAIINAQVAYTYLHAARYEEALTSARDAVELDPGYIPARYYLGWAYQMNGQFEDAIREYLQVAQPLPLFRQVLAQAYAAAGRREEV